MSAGQKAKKPFIDSIISCFLDIRTCKIFIDFNHSCGLNFWEYAQNARNIYLCDVGRAGEIFVKLDKAYFASGILLGKKTDPAAEHICQGPPKAEVATAK